MMMMMIKLSRPTGFTNVLQRIRCKKINLKTVAKHTLQKLFYTSLSQQIIFIIIFWRFLKLPRKPCVNPYDKIVNCRHMDARAEIIKKTICRSDFLSGLSSSHLNAWQFHGD